jgi:hypothetical protein
MQCTYRRNLPRLSTSTGLILVLWMSIAASRANAGWVTKTDISDALLAKQQLSQERLAEMDLNADGKLDVADLVYLLNTFDETEWTGILDIDGNRLELGFVSTQAGGGYQGKLKSDGAGIFPAGEWSAQVGITTDTFQATVSPIPIPPSESYFAVAMTYTLELSTVPPDTGYRLSPTTIQGRLTKTMLAVSPDQQHLNRTLQGRFYLIRQTP